MEGWVGAGQGDWGDRVGKEQRRAGSHLQHVHLHAAHHADHFAVPPACLLRLERRVPDVGAQVGHTAQEGEAGYLGRNGGRGRVRLRQGPWGGGWELGVSGSGYQGQGVRGRRSEAGRHTGDCNELGLFFMHMYLLHQKEGESSVRMIRSQTRLWPPPPPLLRKPESLPQSGTLFVKDFAGDRGKDEHVVGSPRALRPSRRSCGGPRQVC